jgi:hypothetical protein
VIVCASFLNFLSFSRVAWQEQQQQQLPSTRRRELHPTHVHFHTHTHTHTLLNCLIDTIHFTVILAAQQWERGEKGKIPHRMAHKGDTDASLLTQSIIRKYTFRKITHMSGAAFNLFFSSFLILLILSLKLNCLLSLHFIHFSLVSFVCTLVQIFTFFTPHSLSLFSGQQRNKEENSNELLALELIETN